MLFIPAPGSRLPAPDFMTARIEQTSLVQGEAGTSARAQARDYAERFRAPFALRCGALLIDYILIVIVVVFSTVWARLLGGGARMAGGRTETIGLLAAVAVAALNFILLAGVRGQTLGKWATGLRIELRDGSAVGIGRVLLRHTVGYTLSLLIFGLGFLFRLAGADAARHARWHTGRAQRGASPAQPGSLNPSTKGLKFLAGPKKGKKSIWGRLVQVAERWPRRKLAFVVCAARL
jgi:uncharacterized RDD family membrane protein YckC